MISHDFFTHPGTAALLAQMHPHCFKRPWDAKAFSDLLQLTGTVVHIMSIEGQPIGFTLYQTHMDEAEILTLGILPDQRGKTSGSHMVLRAINYLEDIGVRRLFLEVAETNEAALKLYRKTGFTHIGRRKGYYKGNEGPVDALVFERLIDQL